ncbi:MAG: hypothetical protein IJY92_06640 [Alphaproteobacteria bacterium]|nr:hypothetical protein [Alphaproteobacteria bacterium]
MYEITFLHQVIQIKQAQVSLSASYGSMTMDNLSIYLDALPQPVLHELFTESGNKIAHHKFKIPQENKKTFHT